MIVKLIRGHICCQETGMEHVTIDQLPRTGKEHMTIDQLNTVPWRKSVSWVDRGFPSSQWMKPT